MKGIIKDLSLFVVGFCTAFSPLFGTAFVVVSFAVFCGMMLKMSLK
jgi:hypothetical protein